MDRAIVIDTPRGIQLARMSALKYALRLEILGMKRHGRSVYSIVKEEWGLHGTRQSVLDQFTALVEREVANGI